MAAPELSPARAGRFTVIVIVAALVLGSCAAAWWLRARHLPIELPHGAQLTGESGRLPSDPLVTAQLARQSQDEYALDLEGIHERGFLTDEEWAVYRNGGTQRAKLLVAELPEGTASVLVARMASTDSAHTAVTQLGALEFGYGFQLPVEAPPGVEAGLLAGTDDVPAGGRAHYARGNVLVRVEFRGPDTDSAFTGFIDTLNAQLRAVAPDE